MCDVFCYSWQVISPVEAVGYVVVVDQLLSVQNETYSRPTILVAKSVRGEEEIPDGAVAVLTPDMPDVLSHVSVRARNSKVVQLFLFSCSVRLLAQNIPSSSANKFPFCRFVLPLALMPIYWLT